MSEAATHEAIEAIARNSYGRLIAFLASRSGDVAGAEDALSEAFLAALERWPMDAVPQRPEAWLLRVARNRLIDAARHDQVRQDSETFLRQLADEAQTAAETREHFPDERLKLLQPPDKGVGGFLQGQIDRAAWKREPSDPERQGTGEDIAILPPRFVELSTGPFEGRARVSHWGERDVDPKIFASRASQSPRSANRRPIRCGNRERR